MTAPDDPVRAALTALLVKWRERAETLTAMGYSQQGDQVDECNRELSEALGVEFSRVVETPAARFVRCLDCGIVCVFGESCPSCGLGESA